MPRLASQNIQTALSSSHSDLGALNDEIIACTLCPRLIAHCRKVGEIKRRAYLDWDYWAKPVPGFGDPNARLLILGLAPGAHGSNRTGRPFTGDGSGNFLYPVLHQTGFASQPESVGRGDGLELRDLYITATLRCAPPQNKPLPAEIANCAPFLDRELAQLTNVRAVRRVRAPLRPARHVGRAVSPRRGLPRHRAAARRRRSGALPHARPLGKRGGIPRVPCRARGSL